MQFPPRPGAAPRAAAPAPTWPRLYAQHVRTGEIFELTRGERLDTPLVAEISAQAGAEWLVWIEYATARPGAGRPARVAREEGDAS